MGAVVRYRRHGWVVAASLGSLSSSGCGVDPPGFAGGPPVDSGAADARPLEGSDASGVAPPPLNVRLDSSFGQEGNVGGALADWSPVGVALDAQGRLVVSGPGGDPAAPVSEVVRRFTPDGALDVAFGASGKVTFALSPDTWGQAVRVLPGGGIGVLGAASLDGDAGSFAVRMNADGATDTTFAGSLLLTSVTGRFSAGLWQDDGGGLLFGAGASLRFDAGGGVDASYGTGGLTPPSVAGAFVTDGRVWTAAGSRVSRYLATGALDATFGQGGAFDLPWGDGGPETPVLQCILIDARERAVVIGAHPSAPSYDVDVTRLTASGGVDATYGAGGVVSVPAEGGPVGAAQLADGRVLVWTSYGELLAIAPDGAPDSTWKLDVSGTVLAATLDASQRLVVVGMTTSDPARSMWFVRRYLLM